MQVYEDQIEAVSKLVWCQDDVHVLAYFIVSVIVPIGNLAFHGRHVLRLDNPHYTGNYTGNRMASRLVTQWVMGEWMVTPQPSEELMATCKCWLKIPNQKMNDYKYRLKGIYVWHWYVWHWYVWHCAENWKWEKHISGFKSSWCVP